MKILFLDYMDDEAQSVIASMAKSSAWHVFRLVDVENFKTALSSTQYDIILIALTPDDHHRIDLIHQVRNIHTNSPLILIVPDTDEQTFVHMVRLGADDCITHSNISRIGNAITTFCATLNSQPLQTFNITHDPVLNLLPGGVYQFIRLADGSYSLPLISEKFQLLMGIKQQDVRDDATLAFDQVHPDDIPEMMSSIENSAASLSQWEYEFRVRKLDNSYIWIKGISVPKKQSDGSIIWSGILLDINQQKSTQLELSESEISLRNIIDNVEETFYRCNLDGNILMISQSIEKLLGYQVAQFQNSNIKTYFSGPHQFTTFYQALCDNDGVLPDFEFSLVHKNGQKIWISTSSRLFVNKHGDTAGIEGIFRDITARHESDLAMLDRHQRLEADLGLKNLEIDKQTAFLQAILDNSVDCIITIDNKGIITTINSAVTKTFGYDDAELIGKNINILMPEPYHSEHNEYLRSYIETGQAKILGSGRQVLGMNKNGDVFPIEINVTEIMIHGKQYFTGTIRDISVQQLLQHELVTKEQRYNRAHRFANIGTWDWNIQTGELFWSERIAPLFGYPEGNLETTYDNFLAAVHPDDRQLVIDSVNACVQENTEYNIEHRCVWPDGSVHWLLEKGDVSRAADGTPLHMLGVVQDITRQKQYEMELKESQSKLNSLFELSQLGIALTDMQGKYLEYNEAFRRICGYPAEELNTLDYWTLTPREYEQIEAQQLASLSRTGRYGPYEKEYRQKNGNLIPIRLNGLLIRDKNGNENIWSIVEDISDSRHVQQQLINAKNDAEHANRAKSEFLSSMSHELRTPLNAIIGFSQLLELDDSLSSDQMESISEIHHAGIHLLDLINEILDLTKIESGRIDLSIANLDINTVIQECILLSVNTAEKHHVSIEFNPELHTPSLYVLADRVRLKQVIINLLSNAIKYNHQSGHVYIDYQASNDNQVQISIRDTGIGIPKNQLANLFQPFNRLGAEKSSIEGTGIGLVITKTLVELMHGTISVESKLESGTTFTFSLPCPSISITTTKKRSYS